MRHRSIAAAAGCTLLLATGCATNGEVEITLRFENPGAGAPVFALPAL